MSSPIAPSASGDARPTIRDVAREAGVSHATVSRVLNGGKWVGEGARLAVEQAIAKTGYRTNLRARALALGRSNTYAFLLTQPQRQLFQDPTYAVLVHAASEALAEREQAMVIIVAGTELERRRALEYVAGGHIDGVLVLSPHEGDPLLVELERVGVPVVCNGGLSGWHPVTSTVTVDDHGGAVAAVEHLVASGCRRIATITGPDDSWGGRERLRAWRETLSRHGLEAGAVATGDWSRASGVRAMTELLATDTGVDGVFAANDSMAAGALDVLRQHGKRVPQDVRLVGFDDAELAASLDPPLTTVRVSLEQLAREMVRIVAEPQASSVRVTLPTQLVVRESAPAL